MLRSALYLSSLQHLLEKADRGARWLIATGTIVRTNSRFYVDDGLLPAESKQALQSLLDVVSHWIRFWRTRIRLGPDKTAYMCTGGLDASRNCPVYITTFEGIRMALPAVSLTCIWVFLSKATSDRPSSLKDSDRLPNCAHGWLASRQPGNASMLRTPNSCGEHMHIVPSNTY